MENIEKIKIRLHDAAHYTDAHELAGVINTLIDKVNELTERVNCIHEWKLQKEGI